MNLDGAIDRLKGRGTKGKELDDARPPSADIPVVSSKTQLAAAAGDGQMQLRSNSYILTRGVKWFRRCSFLKVQQRIIRPATSRSVTGVVNGGTPTSDYVVAVLEQEARKKTDG